MCMDRGKEAVGPPAPGCRPDELALNISIPHSSSVAVFSKQPAAAAAAAAAAANSVGRLGSSPELIIVEGRKVGEAAAGLGWA